MNVLSHTKEITRELTPFGVLVPIHKTNKKEFYLFENPTYIIPTKNQIAAEISYVNGVVILKRFDKFQVSINDVSVGSKELQSGDKITVIVKDRPSTFYYDVVSTTENINSIMSNSNALSQEDIKTKHKDKILGILKKLTIHPSTIDETLDTLQYPLNPSFLELLLGLVYIYTSGPQDIANTLKLPFASRKILLAGPYKSELMQDAILRAVAKHFNLNLIIFDDSLLEEVVFDVDDAEQVYEDAQDIKIDDRVVLVDPAFPNKHSSLLKKGTVFRIFKSNPTKVAISLDAPSDKEAIVCDISMIRRDTKPLKYQFITALMDQLNDLLEENEKYLIYLRGINNYIRVSAYEEFKRLLDDCNKRVVFVYGAIFQESVKIKREKNLFGAISSLLKADNQQRNLGTALSDLSPLLEAPRDRKLNNQRSNEPPQSQKIASLFMTKLKIHPEGDLVEWNKKMDMDDKKLKHYKNITFIKNLLKKNKIYCNFERNKHLTKRYLTIREADQIVAFALSHMLQQNPNFTLDAENRIVIDEASMDTAIKANELLSSSHTGTKTGPTRIEDIECENEYEKKIAMNVTHPEDIQVTFEDIGALESVKKVLVELVMLPLQRPELFKRGNLVKPCKGVLLFGPPGTGKTMLAKAVATESGANFMNISMSSITSKWFGDGEKYTKAIFTLASRLSPCVVFIDEVDSFLGKRRKGMEHEETRKIKNEFMTLWDGLKSKENERVLIMAATNRPFDLDEAVLRRLPRRLLVDLPSYESRKKILKVILAKETLNPDVDIHELATLTEGFSGSDIKNLCVEAAHEPIREYLRLEKEGKIPKPILTKVEPQMNNDDFWSDDKEVEHEEPNLRPIVYNDFVISKTKFSPSVMEESESIRELREWNEMYGEGGSRTKSVPAYFM